MNFRHYGNVTLYIGSDFMRWAAFTARFSRSTLPPLDLWIKEFAKGEVAVHRSTDEGEEAFLDRVVVEYGDSSVMEMAPVCFYVKRISILLSLLLTDPRYGWSPMERSTRRQKMIQPTLSETNGWTVYTKAYDAMLIQKKAEHPEWSVMQIRDETCDAIRHLVPLDAFTVMGFTCNARSFLALYHDLKHRKFCGLSASHPVMEEMDCLKNDLHALFSANYQAFARKLEDAYDTSIDDINACILFEPLKCNREECHRCIDLRIHTVHTHYLSAYPPVAKDRKTRHGAVPILFDAISVCGEIYSNVAIHREFKRHRLITCYSVICDTTEELTLNARMNWMFTTTLGHLMQMLELRTEYKAHADFRLLCDSILNKMKDFGVSMDGLHRTFHFVEQ